MITNSTGGVVENTFYSPYGEILGGGSKDVKLYTGQFKDNVLCQYYYGRRYFSPCWGMFTQADPTILNPYNPQSLNRYTYALNNPYRYKDESGNLPVKAEAGNLEEFERYVKSIEDNTQLPFDLGEKQVVMAKVLRGFQSGEAQKAGAPNLIRTEKGGWVDTRHYVFSALVSSVFGTKKGLEAGYVVEVYQFIDPNQRASFLNPEDIPSYKYGAYSVSNKPFSSDVKSTFTNLGAINKKASPDWSYLPESRQFVKPGLLPPSVWNPWTSPTDSYWKDFWKYNREYAEEKCQCSLNIPITNGGRNKK